MKDKEYLTRELGRIAGKYSNTAYRSISKDEFLNQIPDKLHSLWCSSTDLSVILLVQRSHGAQQDLASFEKDIMLLERQLKKEFKRLKKTIYRKDVFIWKTQAVRHPLTLLDWEK